MRIWIIDHYAVPEHYNPLIRQTIFARKLGERGHEVRIFSASTVHNSKINLIEGNEKYRSDYVEGVYYTYIKCHDYQGNGVKRILNMEEFARKLPKVCDIYAKKEGKPDIILSCSMTLQACKQGIKLAKKYNAKPVAQVSDLWPESIIAYGKASKNNPAILYLRRMEKWIYTHAEKVIFTMEGAYDYILEQGWEKDIPRSKVSYINNGIDLKLFQYNKEHYVIEDADLDNSSIFKVVYAGSIRKVNNLGLLLDVAKKMQNESVQFLIWGDGDEREALERRLKEEKIGNVFFKGKVEKKYIPYITSKADLNIAHNTSVPLFRFGISFNKIFDYMAAGKPILADFSCPYNPIVMTNCGFEVKNPTAENISVEILKIKNLDKQSYDKYCACALAAAKKYDFERLTDNLISIVEK